jgi:hypothetical protein
MYVDKFKTDGIELPATDASNRSLCCRGQLKCDGTRAEIRFPLSAKRAISFKLAGASVQSTTGSRGVLISSSNAVYTMFRDSVRVLATHSIHQFPLHFPFHASPCAITFQLESTNNVRLQTEHKTLLKTLKGSQLKIPERIWEDIN